MHFAPTPRKSTTGFTGHRSLYRGVQREDVGLVGDIIDELDDVADLLGTLAEPFDTLGCLLDRLANRVHALDGAPYGVAALVRHIY